MECADVPTQVLTLGDHWTVKSWDVSHAVGMDNPLSGGKYSRFADCSNFGDKLLKKDMQQLFLGGEFVPLVSLQTGFTDN
jgi:hypothetical protein